MIMEKNKLFRGNLIIVRRPVEKLVLSTAADVDTEFAGFSGKKVNAQMNRKIAIEKWKSNNLKIPIRPGSISAESF